MKDNSYLKYAKYYILFSLILIQLTASCTLLRPKAQQFTTGTLPTVTLSSPANNATGVSLTPTLTWTATNATSYDIYYGTSSTPPLVASNVTSLSYTTGTLTSGTPYYWKIVAKNAYGNDTSTVWYFTNRSELVYISTNSSEYEEYMNTIDSMIVIKIPAGNFTMGSDAGEGATYEEPEHVVYISAYYIGKYEVTNKQYKKFCDATSRSYPSDPGFDGMSSYFTSYPDYPVVMVSWYDAVSYCAWAGLRLPTEAEWEKASRGSADERTYPWGDNAPYYNSTFYCNFDPCEYGFDYDVDGYYFTCPVTAFSIGKSPYGCYNMAGNVLEWCNDWYDESYYSISPSTDPQGPSSGDYKVFRGGSWYGVAYSLRSALRYGDAPSYVSHGNGFRCSASATKTP